MDRRRAKQEEFRKEKGQGVFKRKGPAAPPLSGLGWWWWVVVLPDGVYTI